MDEFDITYRVKLKDEATRALKAFEKELKDTGGISSDTAKKLKQAADSLDELADGTSRTGSQLEQMAKRFGQFAAGSAVIYGTKKAVMGTVDSFSSLEQALNEVRKASGLQGAELQGLKSDIQGVASQLPVATNDLLDFSATAARAGVSGRQELGQFAVAAAKLKIAIADIDSGGGAEGLLRFIGNTRDGIKDVEKIAASLNALDDTSKTSAPRILSMATDISAMANSFNLASQDILAWSTVLAESGVNEGVAASTIGRLGNSIVQASAKGGPALDLLAKVAHMTGAQFKQLADKDMAQAINKIFEGMSRLSKSSQFDFRKALKLDQVETTPVFATLTSKFDRLSEVQKQAFNDQQNLNKLNGETTANLGTYAAKVQLLGNKFEALKAAVGEDFANAFEPVIDTLGSTSDLLNSLYQQLPDVAQKFLVLSAAGTAGMGGLIQVLGQGTISIAALKYTTGLSTGATIAWAAKLGLAGLAIGAVVAAASTLYDAYQKMQDGQESAVGTTDDLREATDKLHRLLGDPSATKSAIDQAYKLAEARVYQARKTQEAIVKEVELRQAELQRAQEAYKSQPRVTAGSALGSDGLGGGTDSPFALVVRGAELTGAKNSLGKSLERKKQIDDALKQATQDLAAAKNWKPGQGTGTGTGENLDIPKKPKKTRKGKTDPAESFAVNTEADTAEMKAKLALIRELGEAESLEYQQRTAQIEATAQLRQRTHKKDAELTKTEIALINARVAADKALKDEEAKAAALRESDLNIEQAKDELNILQLSVDKRDEELFVLQKIMAAKREHREITKEEIAAAREEFQTRSTTDDAKRADQNARDARSEAEHSRALIALIGPDTQARRERIAVLEAETRAKRENRTATQDEINAAKDAARAQYDLDQAQRAFDDHHAERMAIFDAASGALVDFATGAKSAKSAIRDLIKSLVDLVIQYEILLPIRRAFEQGGGVGGGGGVLGSIFGASTIPLPFANGGVFSNGRVIDRPTLFPMAKGMGLMGEAGPEAVMPLTRGPGGKLGVRSSGAGGGVTIAPQINVTVQSDGIDNPVEAGKVIGKVVEAKFVEMVKKESMPGGMLWKGPR